MQHERDLRGQVGGAAMKVVVIVALVATGVLAALLLQDLGRSKAKKGDGQGTRADGTQTSGAPSWTPPTPSELPSETPTGLTPVKEIKPWEAPDVDPATLPPGHYTPRQVGATPPDPVPSQPVPVPPPPPHLYTPPKDNPGGVNGTRPPRPVPGLDDTANRPSDPAANP